MTQVISVCIRSSLDDDTMTRSLLFPGLSLYTYPVGMIMTPSRKSGCSRPVLRLSSNQSHAGPSQRPSWSWS